MAEPDAAIVIVGDEILDGHTQDTNSHWISKRLAAHGVALLRVEVVPDDVEEIEATLRRILLRDAPSLLFVVGGIGPTPDDRTYEAVARALGVDLELRPEAMDALRTRYGSRAPGESWADPESSEALQRMIRVPRGAQPLANPAGAALGCVAKSNSTSLVVLPGVPRELYAMFDQSFEPSYLHEFRARDVTREVAVWMQEARLWPTLNALGAAFPSLRIGSYPQSDGGRVVLRLRGPAPDVDRAMERLEKEVAEFRHPRP